jgi:hypothetical protein
MRKHLSFLGISLLLFLPPAHAQQAQPVAVLEEIAGEVSVRDGENMTTGSNGQEIRPGNLITTGASGRAKIRHGYGFLSTLGPDSMVRVVAILFKISGLTLVYGTLESRGALEDPATDFRVITPVAVASVRGTAFTVAMARDGTSLVGVVEGLIAAGIGREVTEVSAGSRTEGALATGYGAPVGSNLTLDEARAWVAEREKDLASRVPQVLEELTRLQKQEDEDWKEIAQTIEVISQRIVQGQMTPGDRFFFRRVLDIEDRMSARRLLAIHLRELAGITPRDEADAERIRLHKEWEARDWRRRAWEEASEGKTPSEPMPQNLADYAKRMQQDMDRMQQPPPGTVPVRPDTADLFPDVVKGMHLGMSADEMRRLRPGAEAGETGEPDEETPVVYSEKQLSGGDFTREGWFTGMYTIYRGKLIQGAFTAFAGTEKLRAELWQKYTAAFGPPSRHRFEPDWAQPGVLKGSTAEWRGNGVEVILISRVVPGMQGMMRGLELRIRLAGFDSLLENAGQFQDKNAAGSQSDSQLKKDFPELT